MNQGCKRRRTHHAVEIMYSVIALNADPYLELDTPTNFSSHRDALKYAIDVAIVFRAERHWLFAISGPDGLQQWPIEALLLTRWCRIA
jgi:hypothetical protein